MRENWSVWFDLIYLVTFDMQPLHLLQWVFSGATYLLQVLQNLKIELKLGKSMQRIIEDNWKNLHTGAKKELNTITVNWFNTKTKMALY